MQTNKLFRNLILVGLFAIPFIPLIVTPSALFPFLNLYFPFITGKNFIFRIIVEIIFALWLILAIRSEEYRPKKTYLLYSLIGVVVALGLATMASVFPYRSFWSNYERMGGYVGYLHLFAYFVVLISTVRSWKMWHRLFNVSLIANALVLLYAFFQLFGWAQIHQGSVRLDATLGNAAYLAVYCLFYIFIAGYLYLAENKGSVWRFVYAIFALLNVIILYFTETRGAILGFMGGLSLTCVLVAIFDKGKNRKIAVGVILAVIFVVIGFLTIKDTSFVHNSSALNRFAGISLTETTTQSRFLIWRMSLEGFKEHPVLGWGPENYSLVFSKYYNPLMWKQEPWFDRSHNVFLDWLIDAGLLGLIAYLSVFVSAFYYLAKKRDAGTLEISDKKKQNISTQTIVSSALGRSVLAGLLAGYLFQNIFVFDNLISHLLFFTILGFINFAYAQSGSEESSPSKNLLSNKKVETELVAQPVFGALIIIALFFVIYFVNVKPLIACQDLIKSLMPQAEGASKNLEYTKKVFALNTFGSTEATEQLLNETMSVVSSSGVDQKIKNDFAILSLEQIGNRLKKFDKDARSLFFYGTFLENINQVDDALFYLNRAHELSPKKQQIIFELGSAYLRKGELAKALEYFKQAYDLDRDYPEARKLYALAAILSKQYSLAEELVAPIKGSEDFLTDDRFVQTYLSSGNQEMANKIFADRLDFYKNKIKSDPQNGNGYLGLAKSLIRIGQTNEAISILNQATSVDPTVSEQAAELMSGLK